MKTDRDFQCGVHGSLLRTGLRWSFTLSALFSLLGTTGGVTGQDAPPEGDWQGELQTAGEPVRFGLSFVADSSGLSAFVVNGAERIKVPEVSWHEGELRLRFAYFQSTIRATYDPSTRSYRGLWVQRKTAQVSKQMVFTARPAAAAEPAAAQPESDRNQAADPASNDRVSDESKLSRFAGRWQVKFSSSAEPAVGLFEVFQDTELRGTFLTTTGDFRYLAGGAGREANEFRLSCFDGAHAFAFRARLAQPDVLEGEFWSGPDGHETWQGLRDDRAEIPAGFSAAGFHREVDWGALQFPDLQGRPRRLNDPAFAGRVRLIYLFGSWCPNCHDAADFFSKLQTEFGAETLGVVGLAFEQTGNFAEVAQQVELYQQKHALTYPLLIAGLADKAEAGKSVPFLDRVRAYPTALLLDGNGRIRWVYSGFNGPATGAAHETMAEMFRSRIRELLAEIELP